MDLNPPGGDPALPSAEQVKFDSAAAQARSSGRPVEVESMAGTHTTVLVEPNGNTTVVTTEEPTRVVKNGDLVDIDTGLSDTGSVLKPAAVGADVAIGDGIGDEPLATVKADGRSLSLDWPRDLGAPALDGAAATFADTASRDVQVTATPNGFNVHVVLDRAPTSAPVYRLPVGAKGVRLEKTDSGQFVALDTTTGEPVFWIAKPVAWDDTQQGLEAGPEVVVDVEANLENGPEGGQILVLRPDFEWLTADTTVYPVRIDPDVYTDKDSTRGTYVASRGEDDPNDGINTAYSTTNFATVTMMRAGWQSQYRRTRSYLKWSDVARPGTVVKADLRLYQYDARSCTPSALDVFPVTQDWRAEDRTDPDLTGPMLGVWWATTADGKHGQPAVDTASPYKTSKTFVHGSDDTCGLLGPDGKDLGENNYETIDVTAMVKAWDEGLIDNHGMSLRGSETSGDETSYKGFCSRHISTAASATSCYNGFNPPDGKPYFTVPRTPTLIVTYNTPPSQVVETSTYPSSCPTGEMPLTNDPTPELRGKATDANLAGNTGPTGEKLRYDFEIWPQDAAELDDLHQLADPNDPNSGPAVQRVADGSVSGVEQGTLAKWSPAANLVEGVSYAWRVRADDGAKNSAQQPVGHGPWSDWRRFMVDTSILPPAQCSIDGAEIESLQALANETGSSLSSTIQAYGWQNGFAELAENLRVRCAESFAGAAIDDTYSTKGWIGFAGTAPNAAVEAVAAFESAEGLTPGSISVQGDRGYTEDGLQTEMEALHHRAFDQQDLVENVYSYADVEDGSIALEVSPAPGVTLSASELVDELNERLIEAEGFTTASAATTTPVTRTISVNAELGDTIELNQTGSSELRWGRDSPSSAA
ncbi:MAG: DNRLRE domain-containing protein [Sporichthyaceae bacterium]